LIKWLGVADVVASICPKSIFRRLTFDTRAWPNVKVFAGVKLSVWAVFDSCRSTAVDVTDRQRLRRRSVSQLTRGRTTPLPTVITKPEEATCLRGLSTFWIRRMITMIHLVTESLHARCEVFHPLSV
jgi:hypothetical protein